MRAIFWDNDGVLVDTEPLYFEACRDTLAGLGIGLSREQFVAISLARGASVFELAEKRGVPQAEIRRLRAARDARYAKRLEDGAPVREGMGELLARLHGRVPMAVVTSSLREHFELAHASSGLPELFDLVLTREDYDRSKPHPDPYLSAAATLGVPAERAIAVEDTERGLRSATRAGMDCIVLPNGMNGHAAFRGARRIVRSASELGAILDGWLADGARD